MKTRWLKTNYHLSLKINFVERHELEQCSAALLQHFVGPADTVNYAVGDIVAPDDRAACHTDPGTSHRNYHESNLEQKRVQPNRYS